MMILHPWALALALLALVPLTLHLLRRHARRRVVFPALRYLGSARSRSARALRWRDRLLMLVRIALLLTLVIAAAAPLLGRGDARDHWPTDVVILLDNTASMNRIGPETSLLEAQRGRGLAAVRRAGPSDRFWVLPTVGPAAALGVGATEASAGLLEIGPSDATASLGRRFRDAVRLFPAPDPGRRREILVLSDFQATSLPEAGPDLPRDVRVLLSGVPDAGTNGAVAGVEVAAAGPGGTLDVSAELTLFGSDAPSDTVEARLEIEGEIVAIARSPLPGQAVFRVTGLPAGEYAAAVEIPPSGLRADDRWPFVVRTADPPSVRHHGSFDGYVRQALATLAEAGRIALSDPAGEPPDVDVIEGSAGEASIGPIGAATILIPPVDPVALPRFNRLLGRLGTPWRLSAQGAEGDLSLQATEGLPGGERILVSARYELIRGGAVGDSTLVRTSDGQPWLVRGEVSGHPVLLLASPLDPSNTTLPVDAAMVPFLEAVLFRWTALGTGSPPVIPAGGTVWLDADADSVRTPDGEVVRVDGGAPYVPLRAGIHRAFGGGEVALIAASVPGSESDPTSVDDATVKRLLGAHEVRVARSDAEWNDVMFSWRRGASVTPLALVLALLLAVAETVLATPGVSPRRRRARSGRGGGR